MPSTEEELASLVAASDSVKVVGSGHSFSAIAAPTPSGLLLNLDNYGKLLNVDLPARRATFEAGVRIRDMHAMLQPHGLALPTTGAIHTQSYAGAMSTATHGSTRLYGSYASLVVGMRIIAANGTVIECSDVRHPELFRAAKVGLGVVGVISTVTLQLVEGFYLTKVRI